MDITFQVDPSVDPTIVPFVYEHPEIGRDTYTFPIARMDKVAKMIALYTIADCIPDSAQRRAAFDAARALGQSLARTCTLGGAL
ncbi:hypothetical protein [Dyella psychrodurans]|uniref:Uncharacterized protein n=1 Tax=Dyella psychrodurans TaxID=1927960 RepID=A0A370XBZ5_9GAMM|nr:hypothetical protein [Dyella psychrodurans]RDS85916.1 hypothetical protein DWU99_01160 [Dyella psychrodurans]